MNLARTGLAFSLANLASAAFAHGDDKQTIGDPGKVTRTIHVDTGDGFRFTPSGAGLERGATVKFADGNSGKLLRETTRWASTGSPVSSPATSRPA